LARGESKRPSSGSSDPKTFSMPVWRMRSACCAFDAMGKTAAPPGIPRNSRRLIVAPEAWTGDRSNSHMYSGRGSRKKKGCFAIREKRKQNPLIRSLLYPTATLRGFFMDVRHVPPTDMDCGSPDG